ncbi:LOW QUALITY PROTEIN: hypothetical protein ACG7TL_007450 [Trametes sanguinea]
MHLIIVTWKKTFRVIRIAQELVQRPTLSFVMLESVVNLLQLTFQFLHITTTESASFVSASVLICHFILSLRAVTEQQDAHASYTANAELTYPIFTSNAGSSLSSAAAAGRLGGRSNNGHGLLKVTFAMPSSCAAYATRLNPRTAESTRPDQDISCSSALCGKEGSFNRSVTLSAASPKRRQGRGLSWIGSKTGSGWAAWDPSNPRCDIRFGWTCGAMWVVTYVFAFLVVRAVWVVMSKFSRRARTPAGPGKKLPPGPGGLSLLGSVHKMPLKYQEKQFFEGSSMRTPLDVRSLRSPARLAGDVIYLKLFRTPTIVLNSLQAATDVLTNRSAKHSDRPRMVLLAELMNQACSLPAMPYGERFRKHRRWMHEAVGTKERLDAYRSIQQREVRNLLKNLLSSPERFIQHCHLYVAAIMLEIAYGKRVNSLDDELVAVADRAISGINEAGTPGAMIVDFFPSLKSVPSWLPGAGFKARALTVGKYVQAWKDTGYDIVKAAMDRGDPMPCATSTLLEEVGAAPTPEEAEDIKGLACSVYGGETWLIFGQTRGALIVFMLAMTRNPDVLRKAQEEIDSVVGHDRLPDFSDRGSLPYLDAMLEELYRAITRDTVAYPDPEQFRPERFLHNAGKGGTDTDNIPRPSSYVFGFGRRICPGQALADPTLWLAMAQTIAAFDIRRPLDAEGNEVMPPAAFKSGFTR